MYLMLLLEFCKSICYLLLTLYRNRNTNEETTVPVKSSSVKNTLEYSIRVPLKTTLVITPVSQKYLFLPRTHIYSSPSTHIQTCANTIDDFVGREGIFINGATGIPGVTVKVWDGEDFVTESTTDAEGKYIAGPLAPEGLYKLVCFNCTKY
jgi:hypothetical protein